MGQLIVLTSSHNKVGFSIRKTVGTGKVLRGFSTDPNKLILEASINNNKLIMPGYPSLYQDHYCRQNKDGEDGH